MKKVISLVLSLVMLMSVFAVSVQSYAAEYVDNSEVQSMFSLVNNFRTGSDAWYWNKANTEKVPCNLSVYKYDANLEAIAKIRVQELVQKYDHYRPDGSAFSTCTVKDANGNEVKTYGENILRGNSSYVTVNVAFDLWCETNNMYEGQGHRRNMLSSTFDSIGIAGFKADDGNTYWVQEFGKTASGKDDSSTPTPKVVKKSNTLKVTAKKPSIKFKKLKKKNQSLALKKVLTVSNAQGALSYAKTSGNKKITINKKSGKITVKKGLKKGTYKIKIKVTAAGNSAYNAASKTVTVKIKVK